MMAEKKIHLGKTDLQVMPLGIGAWAWGDKMYWGFGNGYGDAECKSAFDAGLAAGIDLFDTAEVYGRGHSETLLGEFVRQTNARILVATKFFPYPWRLRKADLLSALRGSLKRMGLDRVDLYQIHQPLPPVAVETWVDALGESVRTGLARAAGVSNYDAGRTRRAFDRLAKAGIPLATNQLKYSLLDRHIERDGTMGTCRELGVTVIAYSPIEMGLLSGKYTKQNPPGGARGLRYRRSYLEKIQPLIAQLREIGSAHGGKTPAQVALNWTLCKGTVPIPGAKNAQQAQENCGALGWRLTENEIASLDAASASAQR
jgi:aryl-alcohol dehydrogenase-like predicted oxidoreductase